MKLTNKKNRHGLVIASPHTGILDNIFPLIILSGIDKTDQLDVLIRFEHLDMLQNNQLNYKIALRVFSKWNILIADEIFECRKWRIIFFLYLRKMLGLNVFSFSNSLNHIVKKVFVRLLKFFSFSSEVDYTIYNYVIGDIYIYTRKDSEPFSQKIGDAKFISISHAINPFSTLDRKYIFDLPSNILCLALTKSEFNGYQRLKGHGGFKYNINTSIGALRHSKEWQKYLLKEMQGTKVNKSSEYILVVSRAPDKIISKQEMIDYYREIFLFSRLNDLSVIIKPHPCEHIKSLKKIINRANIQANADIVISTVHLIYLISNCKFGVEFYSAVGADFVSFNKVLLQCANKNKLVSSHISAPYGEEIISNYLEFKEVANAVLREPTQYLQRMKKTYMNVIYRPLDSTKKTVITESDVDISEFSEKILNELFFKLIR